MVSSARGGAEAQQRRSDLRFVRNFGDQARLRSRCTLRPLLLAQRAALELVLALLLLRSLALSLRLCLW
jgi:hypothetical protein